jgi:single-stranded DNA-binding protein
MAQSANIAKVLGTVVRNEVRGEQYPATWITLAGEYPVTDKDGKARSIPFYQTVVARGKEGEEAAKLIIGTPALAIGSLHYREWQDDQDRRRTQTNVRAATIRAVNGFTDADIVVDAQGNPRLRGGYARVSIEANISRDPDYKILSGGNAVINMGAAANDSWQKDGEWVNHTNWIRLVAWGDMAESLFAQGLGKGQKVFFEADIVNGKGYTSTKTGLMEYPVSLQIREIVVMGRASGGAGKAAASLDDLMGSDSYAPEDTEDDSAPF